MGSVGGSGSEWSKLGEATQAGESESESESLGGFQGCIKVREELTQPSRGSRVLCRRR